MSKELYGQEYYSGGCGGMPYHQGGHWHEFFDNVAREIVRECNPRTVLDAGCAFGYLVSGLRGLGVDAYGVDISEYAISQADPSIAEYVRIGSATDLPDEHYDIITFIEVAEHLTPDDGRQAIGRICANTDVVLFSSTPDDRDEPTHVNVQPLAYWWRLFRENGFALNVSRSARFVNQHAVWYGRI